MIFGTGATGDRRLDARAAASLLLVFEPAPASLFFVRPPREPVQLCPLQ